MGFFNQEFFIFIGKVIFLSLSGVLAPGPITTVTVGEGSKKADAGIFIALGHGVIEIPLMLLLFFGFGAFLKILEVKILIGFLGGLFLLYMAKGMFAASFKTDFLKEDKSQSPFFAGLFLTATNPYFLLWWITVGASLILMSEKFGLIGFFIFAVVHWSLDLLWLWFLSFLSHKGGTFFGNYFYKIVFIVCAFMLFYFGLYFIFDAYKLFPGTRFL